jgi:gluconokinase
LKNRNLYLVIFGVSGSGKTLMGKMLAKNLGIEFIEGDDFHSLANVEKMKSGHPLTDADRMPWLHILKNEIQKRITNNKDFVLSCSALKIEYRDILRKAGNIRFLFLNVSENVVSGRLMHRKAHFMPPSLLHSQIETLERPQKTEKDIIVVNASQSPQKVLDDILAGLS